MENTQKALNSLLQAIRETNNFGQDGHNSIVGLKLIDRKGCKDMFGSPKPDGKYVRVIWEDNPNRDDGYYDINVECLNTFGVLYTVMQWLNAKA